MNDRPETVEEALQLLERDRSEYLGCAILRLRDRDEAEDMIQELFLKVIDRFPTYNRAYPFRSWSFTILMNMCYDFLRTYWARHRPLSIDQHRAEFETLGEATEDSHENYVLSSLTLSQALDIIETEGPNNAEALLAYELDNLSYQQIANLQGVRVGTVRSRLNRTRKRLRSRLAGVLEEPRASRPNRYERKEDPCGC